MVFTDFIPLLFVLYIYSASPKGSYNPNPSEQSLIKGKYNWIKMFYHRRLFRKFKGHKTDQQWRRGEIIVFKSYHHC